MVTAKGRQTWVRTHGDVELDDQGTPLRIFGVFEDNMERRATAERVRRNEERYALALEGARDGVWDWDSATDEVHFSSTWKAILGYSDDEITNHFSEWESRVPEEDRGRAFDLVQRCIRGGIAEFRVEAESRGASS